MDRSRTILLSFNRFERKKSLDLAVQTLLRLTERYPRSDLCLVLAGILSIGAQPLHALPPAILVEGGYGCRVVENVQHLEELAKLASGLNLSATCLHGHISKHRALFPDPLPESTTIASADVVFLPSFTDNQRSFLLQHA